MSAFVRAMVVVERAISRIESVFASAIVIAMMTIMFVVLTDVLLRYVFNSPLIWAYDLISLYLMAGIFFLALSLTYAANGHVSVDIFVQMLPASGRRFCEIIACVGGIPFFALLGYVGASRSYVGWVNSEAISGLIPWPTWIGAAFIPVGCAVLILRLTYRLIGNIASLVTGRDLMPLIAISGDDAKLEKSRE